jgi:acyl-coenzyme A synthetase/AMP-(fatty) acid ligase
MSRTDDIINVAGHRLSTGALEEACLAHEQVGDGGTTARSVTELARMWCVCSWCGMA